MSLLVMMVPVATWRCNSCYATGVQYTSVVDVVAAWKDIRRTDITCRTRQYTLRTRGMEVAMGLATSIESSESTTLDPGERLRLYLYVLTRVSRKYTAFTSSGLVGSTPALFTYTYNMYIWADLCERDSPHGAGYECIPWLKMFAEDL